MDPIRVKTLSHRAQKNRAESSVAHNGKYRCWITDQCGFYADLPVMVQHFRNVHRCHYDEFPTGTLPFKKTWNIKYIIGENFNHAIKIKGLVFIVHISVNDKGEFGVCILMYTNDAIADQYHCSIQLECGQLKLCNFKAKIISAKVSKHIILAFRHSGLPFSNNNEHMYKILRDFTSFNCAVVIRRKNELAATERNLLERTTIPTCSQVGSLNGQSAGPSGSTMHGHDQSVSNNRTYRPQCGSNNVPILPMINNHDNSSNMPSAPPPYEQPPPYNPQFNQQHSQQHQQQQHYPEDVRYAPIYLVQYKKKDKTCVVS